MTKDSSDESDAPVIQAGVVYVGEEEFIGAMPVRTDLPIEPQDPKDSIGAKEWAQYGNCIVYVPNGGPLNADWTLAEGGTVLIRSTKGGWCMTEMRKDSKSWFVICDNKRVPIVWNNERACWVSTVEV
jgi:hypothetical protein